MAMKKTGKTGKTNKTNKTDKTPRKPRTSQEPPTPARLKLAIQAAYLRTHHMKYAEIGGVLFPDKPVGDAEISRLIAIAKDGNYLNYVLNPLLVSPEEQQALAGLLVGRMWPELQRQLIAASDGSLKSLYVFFSSMDEPTSEAERARQAVQFADAASTQVYRILEMCAVALAVCWGPTVSEIGNALERHRALSAGRLPVMNIPVFPTVGLPPELHETSTEWSSTSVARSLSRALCMSRDVPSLDPVSPVLTGESAREENRNIIMNYLRSLPGYRAVFGSPGHPGLVDQADGLITGAGTNSGWPRFGNDAMQVDGISPERLKKLIVGDMGGVLISAEGQCGKEFKELRQHWTGMTLKQVKRINENAEKTRGPGVVLCATGSTKVDILYELIVHHRVVRHLIIDHHLAEALSERLKQRRLK